MTLSNPVQYYAVELARRAKKFFLPFCKHPSSDHFSPKRRRHGRGQEGLHQPPPGLQGTGALLLPAEGGGQLCGVPAPVQEANKGGLTQKLSQFEFGWHSFPTTLQWLTIGCGVGDREELVIRTLREKRPDISIDLVRTFSLLPFMNYITKLFEFLSLKPTRLIHMPARSSNPRLMRIRIAARGSGPPYPLSSSMRHLLSWEPVWGLKSMILSPWMRSSTTIPTHLHCSSKYIGGCQGGTFVKNHKLQGK